MKPAKFRALLTAVLVIALPGGIIAQEKIDGPTALITTFHATRGERTKLREVMQTEGLAQFERWRRNGIFASYQLLFTSYAADNVPDMFLIVRFDHFTDLARWQRIEEKYPGGLPASAQAIASAETTGTADIVRDSSVAPTTGESQFVVLQYDVLVDMPRYVSYVLGYAVPQFDAWEKAGALSSYACYINQNPAGAPWSSFILLEYKDLKALAAREVIKNQARTQLAASNPEWKRWSDDKTALRIEKAAIAVRALNQP